MSEEAKAAAKVDAVIVPAGYFGGTLYARHKAIQEKFGPVLGTAAAPVKVEVRNQVTYNFITADLQDTIYFSRDHEKAGQPRYRWAESPDDPKIQYGTKVEGA